MTEANRVVLLSVSGTMTWIDSSSGTRSDRTAKVKTAAGGSENLIRLVNSLLPLSVKLLCSYYFANNCQSSTAMREQAVDSHSVLTERRH